MDFFAITHKDKHSRARTGVIHTDHGDIKTPAFMPVGTQATVKSVDNADLNTIGAQIILANTYHLHLRPGEDLIAEQGGLHGFMNWDKPILTDSGGFQVFSLGKRKAGKQRTTILPLTGGDTIPPVAGGEGVQALETKKNNHSSLVEIDDDGVTFRSHLDGSRQRLTPESAIEIQHKLGADIIMAFDECTPGDADEAYAREALERTHHWAERSLNQHKQSLQSSIFNHSQHLFGIVQGAEFKHLREESARFISSLDFDGIAIGGESIGYNMQATKEILQWVMPLIPEDKPHYTMGVGLNPSDLFDVVEHGIDMFDCVSPTRIARNGTLYVRPSTLPPRRGELEGGSSQVEQTINIHNAQHRIDTQPIDTTCDCYTCTHHTRAYLHHLFKAEELLAYRLATIHNLRFLMNMMREMRTAIQEDRFLEMKKLWCNG